MKPTLTYIETKFDEFNRQLFGGQLSRPPIQLSNAKSYLGLCVCKKRRTLLGRTVCYDFRLRFSTRLDLPESEVEDTIIHEMIHYYIGVNQLRDTSSHGQLFRQMMNDINERHQRHVTIRHRTTSEQRQQLTDTRRRPHVIAVVSFRDGRQGIKVLPRTVTSIRRYLRGINSIPDIAAVRLYVTDDPYFNQYPSSSALRVHLLDATVITAHLVGAHPIDEKP